MQATPIVPPAPPGFRITLTHQIVAGLVIGALIGWLAPEVGASLKPISTLFLRLIRMVLGPLLVTTLVAGIAGTGAAMVGRLGIKAIVWFELATTVALVLGLVAANVVKPGVGVDLTKLSRDPAATSPAATPPASTAPAAPPSGSAVPSPSPVANMPATTASAAPAPKIAAPAPPTQVTKPKGFVDFVIEAFPVSFIDAMARNDVLQIVVFSLFLGLAVSAAGARAKAVKELADAGAEAMFKMVGFVMRFAPFGVGAAIATTLGTSGTGVLIPLLKCVLALYAALLVFFALLFTALAVLTRVHIPTFLRAIREPALIAFTTATSDAALPRSMQVLEQLGIPRRIVGFVVPTGYVFNLDGSTLYLALAVMFVAQAAGVEMTAGEQIAAMLFLMLSTKGLAGVPRAALVVLGGALAAFHLPVEGVALLLGIDALMDMGRTCVNVVGNCVATVIVAAWEHEIPASAPIFGPRATPAAAVVAIADDTGA
jgi:proton glutamate symport protein